MKNFLLIAAVALCMVGCGTKYNYDDTGTASPYFKGNIYQYLQSKPYDWDTIVRIINRAQLQGIFERDKITFLGPPNHALRKWFIQGGEGHDKFGYKCVNDIPEATCRAIVLSHVVDGKMLRDQIERAKYDSKGNRVGGGRTVTTRRGNKILLWTKQEPYMGVPDMGPVHLMMTTLKSDGSEIRTNQFASPDIQPKNGVVHAIQYAYSLSDIGSLTD